MKLEIDLRKSHSLWSGTHSLAIFLHLTMNWLFLKQEHWRCSTKIVTVNPHLQVRGWSPGEGLCKEEPGCSGGQQIGHKPACLGIPKHQMREKLILFTT